MLKIRPFEPTEAEYKAVTAIRNANWPDDPKTIEEQKRQDKERPPNHFFQRLMGEYSGAIIAMGQCGETFWLAEPGQYFWDFGFLPDYTNKRFEEQMHDQLVALLAQRRPRKFFVGMRDDKVAQIRFIEARGYRLIQTEPTSQLDMANFDLARFSEVMTRVRERGIHIYTVADLQAVDPEWIYKLWELQWQIRQDVPGHGQVTREPYETFNKQINDPQHHDLSTHFVAVEQVNTNSNELGSYVGMTRLRYNKADPTLGHTHLTGVVRSHRRQGIATALKVQAISRAKAAGVQRIYTMNHEDNPMLGLNIRLGFKPGPAWRYYEKIL